MEVKVSHSVVSNFLQSHGLYSSWNSPGQNAGVGSLFLLQGTLPTQGSNPGLPHCRWILYQLSHRGHPRMLEQVAYPFCRGSSWPGIKPGLLHYEHVLYQVSYQGSSLRMDTGPKPTIRNSKRNAPRLLKSDRSNMLITKHAFPRKSATYVLGWKINHYSISMLWRLTVIFSFPWKENRILNVLKCITQM